MSSWQGANTTTFNSNNKNKNSSTVTRHHHHNAAGGDTTTSAPTGSTTDRLQPQQQQQQQKDDDNHNNHHNNNTGETVEAVLNRLIKSYTIVMECINTFHKLDTMMIFDQKKKEQQQQQQHDQQQQQQQLFRVGRAARHTLEMSIFNHPFVRSTIGKQPYSITTMIRQHQQQQPITVVTNNDRMVSSVSNPTTTKDTDDRRSTTTATASGNIQSSSLLQLISPSHQSTVRQITYLSFINYADLLLKGLFPTKLMKEDSSTSTTITGTTTTITILDRGVIESLRSTTIPTNSNTAMSSASSCWISSTSSSSGSSTSPSSTGDHHDSCNSSHNNNNNNNNHNNIIYESEEDTVRLAVMAYINAVSIDGTDPTVYIKLACATRRLNRIIINKSHRCTTIDPTTTIIPSKWSIVHDSKYRTLERYALESAIISLPMNQVPKNRTARIALQEWWDEEENAATNHNYNNNITTTNNNNDDPYNGILETTTTTFPMTILPQQQQQSIVIELPRYSWSTLGRMLLRACKDGTSYTTNAFIATKTTEHDSIMASNRLPLQLSPTIRIQLSSLIALPTILISNIVSYLSPQYLWPLESTCRALSASMISVRVMLTNDNMNQKNIKTTDRRTLVSMSTTTEQKTDIGKTSPLIFNETQPTTTTGDNIVVPDDVTGEMEQIQQQQQQIKRKSSRVLSQLISSGKRTERCSRRHSTEFCFLSTILGCSTVDDPIYERLVQSYYQQTGITVSVTTDNAVIVAPHSACATTSSTKKKHYQPQQQDLNEYYWNEASLYRFIQYNNSISQQNYLSPAACMFRFVAHASIYTAQVFMSTTDNTASLFDMSSHILECIEWMNHRTNIGAELISCWSLCKNRVPKDAKLDDIEIFAIDLLHAELRLRRRETEEDMDSCDFDGDGNFTSIIFPSLLDISAQMDQKSINFEPIAARQWKMMKIRCYWLTASWYFWRGRLVSNVGESRQAEEEGISWVEETKKCLSGSESIATPHLSSTVRKGQYWKELSLLTLSSFADEVQASTVVLQAQERFLEVTNNFTSDGNSCTPIAQSHCDALAQIGGILMERYSCTNDNSKSLEIIENFLNVHGEQLTALSVWNEAERWSWFADVIPSSKVAPNGMYKFPTSPAIVTILVTCLRTNDEHAITIALILSRLVVTLIDMSDDILARQQIQWDKKIKTCVVDDLCSDYESDIDDDFLSVDEYGEAQNRKQKLNFDDTKLQRYSSLICLLMQRILSFCKAAMTLADQLLFLQSAEFFSIISRCLSFTANLFRSSHLMLGETSPSNNDLGIFVSVQDLFQFMQSTLLNDKLRCVNISRAYVEGLCHIVIVQRQTLSSLSQSKPSKNGKTERIRATRKRADLVAAVCSDLGLLLSSNLATLETDRIMRSEICAELQSDSNQNFRLVAVCDALLWFWKAGTDVTTTSIIDPYLSSYLDEFGRERLRVPVATAIIGLCGSALSERSIIPAFSKQLVSLTEFYDSDASAVKLTDDSDGEDDPVNNTVAPESFRVVVQAVQCISNVFCILDEKEACAYSYVKDYVTTNGPGLPLVVSRVLNVFANWLLIGFKRNNIGDEIWGDFAFGSRSVGLLLDSSLWKAYKCLHGFVLTNETKDSVGGTSGSTGGMKQAKYFSPESKEAAAMLYRCIMRTYAQGRRSPPKSALETVLAALPQLDENKKSFAIRKYLFSAKIQATEVERLLSVALRRKGWDGVFDSIEGFDWINCDSNETFDDEASLVRRGLARLMAHGPIPRIQDNGEEKDWRSTSAQSEEDLSAKFNAVVDDLCFGDTTSWEGWFKASQCLNMKSDVIADRLGLSKGFHRNPKFSIPESRSTGTACYSLSDLKLKHDRELLHHDNGWLQSIGADLSIFIRYHWSTFDCLKSCYQGLVTYYANDSNVIVTDENRWYDIKSLYDKKDFAQWQLALGGLFVSSLRRVAYRCLSLAIYMSNKNNATDGNVHSELVETLAVNLYVELMGSQSYGFPMKVMPISKKRSLATDSLACFERAIALIHSDEDTGDKIEAWSLRFMVGKCHEKIARSFENENFAVGSSCQATIPTRRYEFHMMLALKSYSEALTNASHVKESGGFIGEQNGGSSHGVLEAFYRLHASRLKCLISAVDKNNDGRELAELEALRLTECNWFQVPDSTEVDHSLRRRVWRVLEDVVGALAKCSRDNSYFHRSVYRHAQALMWAPQLYDPYEEKAKSSLGFVPTSWACKLSGLISSTNAATSGLSTISPLFSKKRTQLVGVWVTMDGGTTPFETINNSVRKYDSLRGKYIAAYIDSLRICRRRKELDIFLTWVTATSRDLPSHFASSALVEGAVPVQSPSLDCLVAHDRSIISLHFLNTVRRLCNSALARVLAEDMSDTLQKVANFKPGEAMKYFELQLKIAYACFLRLNCDFKEVAKSRTWLYEKQCGVYDVVEALTVAYTNAYKETTTLSQVDDSDWSGESHLSSTMVTALQKCKELYPSLTRNFSFTRQRTAPKPKSPSIKTGSKRKLSPNHEKKSFEVAIPEGLKEGETFLTSIVIGDTTKRVRLTVPSESASSLRFSLEVPKSDVKNSSDADTKSGPTPADSI